MVQEHLMDNAAGGRNTFKISYLCVASELRQVAIVAPST